jgi:hypothetical protein
MAILGIQSAIGMLTDRQWGIFDQNGNSVVTADNMISFEYRQEWDLLTYPVEDGGFQTFNKVAIPFTARMLFSSGGSFENRQALLDSVDRIAGDLNLYNVLTPEEIYLNASIHHYDYKRTAIDGATLIKVAIWMTQVNDTGTATGSNAQQPGGTDPVNLGQQQTQPPTEAQLSLMDSAGYSP